MCALSPHTDADVRSNGKCGWTETDSGDPCQYAEGRGRDQDTGLCKIHYAQARRDGALGNDNAVGNNGGGAPEGNENAIEHGAYRTQSTDFLYGGEQDAFDDARSLLESPEGAQDVARTAATACLIRHNRSGDPRYLRRFESICDKFNIAPTDELNVEHSAGADFWKDSARNDEQR